MVKANAKTPSVDDKKEALIQSSLWPNMPFSGSPVKIGIMGSTGEYRSGKTLLGLTIAPGAHPEGHAFAGKPRTRNYDMEQSSTTYQGTGAERVDVIEEVMKSVTDPNTKVARIPTPIDIFQWFLKDIEKIKNNQYDVIMVDPVTDIENGLVQYVRKNHLQFGLTGEQVNKGGGLIWGAVKDYWKVILSTIAAKCETFYFTAHLRDEFSGAVPTGKREPKGKDTLKELSSLYLWLERKPKTDGSLPEQPSAIVLKERLSDTSVDAKTGEVNIVKLMPPRIPVATVKEIRKYITHPPDYSQLREEEKFVESGLTEDQKLVIRQNTAMAEEAATANSLQALSLQAKIASITSKKPAVDPTTAEQSKAEAKRAEAQVNHASEVKAAESAAGQGLTESTAKPSVKAKADAKPEAKTEAKAETKTEAKPATEPVLNTPESQIPPESERSTKEQRKAMRLLMFAYKWPTGKTKADGSPKTPDDFIVEGLIAKGCPVVNGAPSAKLMSAKMAQELIDNFTKMVKKQGGNVEEILKGE